MGEGLYGTVTPDKAQVQWLIFTALPNSYLRTV